jgi:hypothetical protein
MSPEWYSGTEILKIRNERLDLLKVIRRLLTSDNAVALIDKIIDDLNQPIPDELRRVPNAQFAEWLDREWNKWT